MVLILKSLINEIKEFKILFTIFTWVSNTFICIIFSYITNLKLISNTKGTKRVGMIGYGLEISDYVSF